jgi:hypothetical protein
MPKRIPRVGGGKVYKSPLEQGDKPLLQPLVHRDPSLSVHHNRQVRHEERLRLKTERRRRALDRASRITTAPDVMSTCARMSERERGRTLWAPAAKEDHRREDELKQRSLNWRIRQAHIFDKSFDIDADGTVSAMDIKVARAVSTTPGQTKLTAAEKVGNVLWRCDNQSMNRLHLGRERFHSEQSNFLSDHVSTKPWATLLQVYIEPLISIDRTDKTNPQTNKQTNKQIDKHANKQQTSNWGL